MLQITTLNYCHINCKALFICIDYTIYIYILIKSKVKYIITNVQYYVLHTLETKSNSFKARTFFISI